jgi:hypothetical protein
MMNGRHGSAAGGRTAGSAEGVKREEGRRKKECGGATPSDDTKKGGWRAALFQSLADLAGAGK